MAVISILHGEIECYREDLFEGTIEGLVLGGDSFTEKSMAKALLKIIHSPTIKQFILVVCENYDIGNNDLVNKSKQIDKSLSQELIYSC